MPNQNLLRRSGNAAAQTVELRKSALHAIRRLNRYLATIVGIVLAAAISSGCGTECPTPEQRADFRAAAPYFGSIGEVAGDLHPLVTEGEQGLTPERRETWFEETGEVLARMQSVADEITNLTPAPGIEKIDGLAKAVAASLDAAIPLLRTGLQTFDAEPLESGGQHLADAVAQVRVLNAELDRFYQSCIDN